MRSTAQRYPWHGSSVSQIANVLLWSFQGTSLSAAFFYTLLLETIDSVMSLALCSQVVSPTSQLATCGSCFSRHSLWLVISIDSIKPGSPWFTSRCRNKCHSVLKAQSFYLFFRLLDTELSPKSYWQGPRSQEVGEGKTTVYLTLHCYHQNDFCIKIGIYDSYFNVSFIVRGKITRCPQIKTISEEKGALKRAHQLT